MQPMTNPSTITNDQLRDFVIARHGDFNEKNFQGKTVLALAVERKQDAIVEMLRQRGALA